MEPVDTSIQSIIAHTFEDESLLQLALTHSSCDLPTGDNQRLEFLGDAVLDLVIAEALFNQFPEANEGALDRCRAGIVNGQSLAQVAAARGLGAHLKVSEAHRQHHPEPSRAMLEDTVEALIGAVYLDGGMEAARRTIHTLFGEQLDACELTEGSQNPKGQLQEWSQKALDGAVPVYSALDAEGPDHDRRYVAAVQLEGRELGRGSGRSKKAAEVAAAAEALRNLP